jgi:hypothetical protein
MTDVIHGEDLIEEGQSSAEITANHLYTIAGLFGSLEVEDTLLAQPGSPTNGQAWIITDTGTITGADWTSTTATSKHPAQNSDVAFYNSGWYLFRPRAGMIAYDKTANRLVSYSDAEGVWYPVQKSWSTTAEFTGSYTSAGGAIWAVTILDAAMPNTATEQFDPGVTVDFSDVAAVEVRASDTTANTAWAFGERYQMGADAITAIIDSNSDIEIVTTFDASAYRAEYRMEYVPA